METKLDEAIRKALASRDCLIKKHEKVVSVLTADKKRTAKELEAFKSETKIEIET